MPFLAVSATLAIGSGRTAFPFLCGYGDHFFAFFHFHNLNSAAALFFAGFAQENFQDVHVKSLLK
jgi:hypothetical protein